MSLSEVPNMIKMEARRIVELDRLSVTAPGIYEIEAEVQWDHSYSGNRFFQVRHSDGSISAISEAMDMRSLQAVRSGRQSKRTLTRLEASDLILEAWSDIYAIVTESRISAVPVITR